MWFKLRLASCLLTASPFWLQFKLISIHRCNFPLKDGRRDNLRIHDGDVSQSLYRFSRMGISSKSLLTTFVTTRWHFSKSTVTFCEHVHFESPQKKIIIFFFFFYTYLVQCSRNKADIMFGPNCGAVPPYSHYMTLDTWVFSTQWGKAAGSPHK